MTLRKTVAAAIALLAFSAEARGEAKGPLTIGINKAAGAAQAEKAVSVLPKLLGGPLGREVRVKVTADYDELSIALLAGTLDLAWMSPLSYVNARTQNKGIVPVAKAMRNGSLYYRAAFIVPKDSQLWSLKDLKGNKVAWVSKSSTSGYLFPRALLKRQGIDADTFFSEQIMAGSHDAACKMVIDGNVAAAATFADEPGEGATFKADGCGPAAGAVRILAKTGPISNDVLVARSGLPADEVKAIAELLGTMSGNPGIREAFRADGFGIAQESDFDPVEQASKLLGSVTAESK